MLMSRKLPSITLWLLFATIAASVGMCIPRSTASAKPGAATVAPPAPAAPTMTAVASLVAKGTHATLQDVFTCELRDKSRYLESAKVADREGYPYVAQLFRACAAAEQVHADQHVHAIAWAGDEARAYLDRVVPGTTAENLQSAVDREHYEATEMYPALLARARADHMPMAVRSMNYALAAEREHERLFAAALAGLDQRAPRVGFFVCPACGHTVQKLDFAVCSNCFNPGKKFMRVD